MNLIYTKGYGNSLVDVFSTQLLDCSRCSCIWISATLFQVMSHCQFTTRKDLCSQDRRYTTQPVNQFQSILSISSRAQPVKQIDQKPLFLGFSKENWHI